ncbi:MFS monocarboxylate [Colletotrichum sojae]|uniref:MFS monocarboxylate n=1 Tax=Colletotrichum sojae TaxID=2175907 RepID=A0A8H6MR98_9PEZI|nr:MFS monocarboxylate [Colletotrichum sojae]
MVIHVVDEELTAHLKSLYAAYRHTKDIDAKAAFFSPACYQICRPKPSFAAQNRETIVRYLHETAPKKDAADTTPRMKGCYTIRPLKSEEFEFGTDEHVLPAGFDSSEKAREKVDEEGWVGMRVDLWSELVDEKVQEDDSLLVKVQYWWRKEDGEWTQIFHDIIQGGGEPPRASKMSSTFSNMDSLEMTTPSVESHPSERDETVDPNSSTEFHGPQHQLKPTDRGLAAWRLLLTAFVFEALLWGFPLSFGVFQNYYSKQPAFASNRYIPVVGSVASGISYLGAPAITPLIKRFQRYQGLMIWIGSGVVLASFCTTVETLILTQGVAYGVGFLIFYYPILNMVNEFWITRRGMAYGLLCSSSGVSGAVFPFVIEALLEKYGYQTTLRAVAVALCVLTGPLIPLLKGRLPPSLQSTSTRMNWGFLRDPLFWVFSLSNIAQGLGYFFPSLYLPSYAASIGLRGTEGALLLALMSISQVAGQLTFGSLTDRKVSLEVLTTVSTIISATSAFALWGLAHTLPLLIVFALVYGFFAAGYTAMWARMTTAVSTDSTAVPMIFSLFNFGKGVGNVLAGPISGNLLFQMTSAESYGLVKYRGVVVFTGSCMIFSTVAIGLKYVRPCWPREGS